MQKIELKSINDYEKYIDLKLKKQVKNLKARKIMKEVCLASFEDGMYLQRDRNLEVVISQF